MIQHCRSWRGVPKALRLHVTGWYIRPLRLVYEVTSTTSRHYGTHMAIGPHNELFITVGRTHRIQVRNVADGTLIREWGTFGFAPGELYMVSGLAAARVDNQTVVAVTQSSESVSRVQLFDECGQLLQCWNSDIEPRCFAFVPPHANAAEWWGLVGGTAGRIQKFRLSDGVKLDQWTVPHMPDCLCVSPSYDRVFISSFWDGVIYSVDLSNGGLCTRMFYNQCPMDMAVVSSSTLVFVCADTIRFIRAADGFFVRLPFTRKSCSTIAASSEGYLFVSDSLTLSKFVWL